MADAQHSVGIPVLANLPRRKWGTGPDPEKVRAKRRRHYLKRGKDVAREENRRNLAKRMADPVEREKIRVRRAAWRKRDLERNHALGLGDGGMPLKRGRRPAARDKYSPLAEQNARQAWRWWLANAPNRWMRAYWRAVGAPWRNPRLTDAQQWRIRYWLDAEFHAKEYERVQAAKAKRSARIAAVNDGTLTGKVILAMFDASTACPYCDEVIRSPRKTLDHMHPLSRGGSHSLSNAIVCCSSCNYRKGRMPWSEWLAKASVTHEHVMSIRSMQLANVPATGANNTIAVESGLYEWNEGPCVFTSQCQVWM